MLSIFAVTVVNYDKKVLNDLVLGGYSQNYLRTSHDHNYGAGVPYCR